MSVPILEYLFLLECLNRAVEATHQSVLFAFPKRHKLELTTTITVFWPIGHHKIVNLGDSSQCE